MGKDLEDLNELERKIQEIAFVDSEKYIDFKSKIDEIRESLDSSDSITSTMKIAYLGTEIDQYFQVGNLEPNLVFDPSEQIENGEEAIKNHKVKLFVEASDTVKRSEFKNIDKVIQLRKLWELDKQKRDYSQVQIEMVEKSFANMVIAYQSWYYTQSEELPELDVSELCSLGSYEHELKEILIEKVVKKDSDSEEKRKIEILFFTKDVQELISDKDFWKIVAGDKKTLEENQNTALEQLERESKQTKPAEKSPTNSDFSESPKIILTLRRKIFGQEVLVKKKIPVKDGRFIIPLRIRESIIEAEIPEGVTAIGIEDDFVFRGDDTFEDSNNLKKVKLPSSLKKIGARAFYDCNSLEEINFPEGLEYIGAMAFVFCRSLTKVDLPNGIKKIGVRAFDGCRNLREINFPEELEFVGSKTFEGCGKLKIIKNKKDESKQELMVDDQDVEK